MRRELDIRGLKSQVWTAERLQKLRRHARSLSDEPSRSPRLTVESVDARCRRGRAAPAGPEATRTDPRLWRRASMSRIPRIRCGLSAPTGLAQIFWPPPPPPSSANWGGSGPSAYMGSAVGWLSFRRIVDIPFEACVAALESWQRTGQDGEQHLGQGLLRGPIEADRDSGTCRIQVRLARGPLRRSLLMRLDIDRLSSSRTALELIPGKLARPTAGYFRAGHRLLDSLTRALSVCARNASRTTSARSRPADVPQPPGAPGTLAPGSPQVATNPAGQAAPSPQQMQSGTYVDTFPGRSRAVI